MNEGSLFGSPNADRHFAVPVWRSRPQRSSSQARSFLRSSSSLAHLVPSMMNNAGNVVKASAVKTSFAAKPGSSIQPIVTSCQVNTMRHERSACHFRISAQHTPRLSPYEVLKHPHFTEDALRDIERQNMLVIIVDVRADKGQIKAAVQDILGVKVEKVNILIRPDGKKKAFVQLTSGYDTANVLC